MHKSEELNDEAMSFITKPKNVRSAKTCCRYQNQHVKHCKEDAIRDVSSETALVHYFSNLVFKGTCSPRTMWCVCSFFRSHTIVQCKIIIKDCIMLRMRAKKITQDHIASKPNRLQHSEIKLVLTTLFDENDYKDLSFKVAVAMIHFFC